MIASDPAPKGKRMDKASFGVPRSLAGYPSS
jgi:hypothetical protein